MNLSETFKEFKDGKNIDRPTMVRVLEDVFRSLIKKKYGSDDNFDVIVNTISGDLELWRKRLIVPDGEVTDEQTQISIMEALTIDSDYEVGEECLEQIDTDEFGRRAVMAARQTLVSRILELEKDEVFKRYEDRIGDLVICEVNQMVGKEIFVLDDATGQEMVLPRTEMIKGDFFRKGESTKAIIKKVEMRNSMPVITISRTDPDFLEKLMEQEVPEIEDGLITIKKIVRIPGERAKVAVESYDDRIDPVGACVGMKGSRIHGIVRELRNENIDIVNFTTNTTLYLQRSLTPAKVTEIQLFPETKRASVFLKPDQVSLAIGKNGSNIKLAAKLTGYEIDVYRDNEEHEMEDVELDEFADEIDGWIIDALKSIGCDTARSVLRLSVDELVRRADLEESTAQEVLKILESEFEE
jgi:N utilization substance protein A